MTTVNVSTQDDIYKLGTNEPVVYRLLHFVSTGEVTFEQAMMTAVSLLASRSAELMAMNIGLIQKLTVGPVVVSSLGEQLGEEDSPSSAAWKREAEKLRVELARVQARENNFRLEIASILTFYNGHFHPRIKQALVSALEVNIDAINASKTKDENRTR